MTRVLVAYASKMGATREIAEAVCDELRTRGLHVDIRDLRHSVTLTDYEAVVLGSAVYAGRWRSEAARFVRRHANELLSRRVWLFESGWVGPKPTTLRPTPRGRNHARRIAADAPTVFGGRLDPELARGFFDRALAKRMPGDARDFDVIRSWAGTIADALAPATNA